MAEWTVLWDREAEKDLDAIVDFIAQEHPLNAARVLERLLKRAASLETQPMRGRRVPELLALGEDRYRELIEAPWRILYRADVAQVLVIAVVDTRRDLQSWLAQRFSAP